MAQPIQVISLMMTVPCSTVRWMAPVGQPIMQTGSAQCIHAFATIKLSNVLPCRRKRGLPPCVDAQALTQSSQRTQRSRLITIARVALTKRSSTAHSISASSATGVAAISIVVEVGGSMNGNTCSSSTGAGTLRTST